MLNKFQVAPRNPEEDSNREKGKKSEENKNRVSPRPEWLDVLAQPDIQKEAEEDLELLNTLQRELNFDRPESRRLLLIAWCLVFARPDVRPGKNPFFRRHFIKNEPCLFVGSHLEEEYVSLPSSVAQEQSLHT